MSENNLESLMRDVARTVQGDARRRQLLPEIQARLAKLDEQSRQSQRAHGTWRLTFLGAAACAAGIAVFVLRPMPLSYAVDGAGAGRAGAVGAIGERLVASDAGPLSLRFSDGSQVMLPPHAQAHVDALDAHGATVALEGGTVDVSVVHRAKTHWSIRAGRYTIRVTGTKFSAGWDRKADTLTVTMREGSVEVTGPGMKAPAPPDTAEAEASPQPDAPKAASRREIDRKAPRGRHGAAPTLVASNDGGWRALYKHGKYPDGLAAAEREGFEEICARGGVQDVLSLGDLARLAHDYNRAEQAYRAANRRFNHPAEAVMNMGRIELDQHNNPAAAARWFDEYVKRFPHGTFAQEVAGLLLESRLKAGDNAGARDAAKAYLSSFPDGPRAKQARGIVSH